MNNKSFIYTLLIFFIISINSIYSFTQYLTTNTYSLVIRQSIFYIIGIVAILIIIRISPETILKYSFFIYIVNVLLLIVVLLIGTPVNGTKAWFKIPLFGTFQPSEFMKIGLILYIAKILDSCTIKNTKDEFLLLIKTAIVTLIPSILTFLEPDTGAVLIYFIITFAMLFVSKIRIRWFVILITFICTITSTIFYLYINKTNLFIKVFGSSMFYRFDRIFDWKSSSGMQLENSIITIGSSGYLGKGINNILLYFPEGHTDFIFSSYASIYGLTGIIILLITIIYFDTTIIKTKTNSLFHKYILTGIISSLLYQQIQNISMTIGLLPITGITLPFISYGGSSLLSYMVLIGIVMSIRKDKHKKRFNTLIY